MIAISPAHWRADCCLAASYKHSSYCWVRLREEVIIAPLPSYTHYVILSDGLGSYSTILGLLYFPFQSEYFEFFFPDNPIVELDETCSEYCGIVTNIPASYLGGPAFKSQLGDHRTYLRFFVISLRLYMKIPKLYRKFGHDRFFAHPFYTLFTNNFCIWCQIIWIIQNVITKKQNCKRIWVLGAHLSLWG
jgi:hypothetical protein